jgi:hypothetical protein
MARKMKGNDVPQPATVTEAEVKPVRLALAPEYHRLLRKVAADDNMSMAEFAKTALMKVIDQEVKARGIKR